MSKKKKGKNNNPRRKHGAKKKEYREELLDDMKRCASPCSDVAEIGEPNVRFYDSDLEQIEYYLQVLPGIHYVKQQLLNYLFSNDLTTGTVEGDEKLNAFLYTQNRSGVTNYSVLQDVIGLAALYGECGLRYFDGGLYPLVSGTYAPLLRVEDGITNVVAFVTTADGSSIAERKVDMTELQWFGTLTEDTLRTFFKDQNLVLLDKSEFVNIRNSTAKLFGESPLLVDDLRLDLLVTTYEQLIDDLKYNGPGRLVLRPREDYIYGDDNEVSTTELVNSSPAGRQERLRQMFAELERLAEELKNSSPDSIITLSNGFSEKIEKLEKLTKSTEFFDWIENEGTILASVIGLSPSLLEVGNLSGNVSMTSIVDNAMANDIIPTRKRYAAQFSPMLSYHLGLSKVMFGEYIPQSQESPGSARMKIATMAQQLGQAYTSLNEMPEIKEAVGWLMEQLDYDIHDSNGGIVELSLGYKDDPIPGQKEK